jgi:FkbM family methyltransferase
VTGSGVLPAALSDEIGMVRFALQESNSGIRNSASPDDGSIVVPCTTLTSILADRPNFRPNPLKLDLQGHELQAMRGAGEQLHSLEIIICEM